MHDRALGPAARTSSRRRSTAPGWPASAASRRNSVGVSDASPPCRCRLRHRVQPQRPVVRPAASAPARRSSARSRTTQLGEVQRLGQVVVAAGAEAGEPVGDGVAGREEQHRGVDAVRAQRLADVAPVGVGQADVDDEPVGRCMPDEAIASRPVRPLRSKPSSPECRGPAPTQPWSSSPMQHDGVHGGQSGSPAVNARSKTAADRARSGSLQVPPAHPAAPCPPSSPTRPRPVAGPHHAEQGPGSHVLLLGHQDHVHDGRRDRGRLPQRSTSASV